MIPNAELLIVEDNKSHAQLIWELLDESPFKVHWSDNMSAAFDYIDRGAGVDCVLLDLLLPDSHGEETFLEFKKRLPETPIVVLSGLDYGVLGPRMLELGAADYLQKATDMETRVISHSVFMALQRKAQKAGQKADKTPWIAPNNSLPEIMRNLITDSSDPMALIDLHGRVFFANLPYHHMIGQTPAQKRAFPFECSPTNRRMIEFQNARGEMLRVCMRIDLFPWNQEPVYLAHFHDQRQRDLLSHPD